MAQAPAYRRKDLHSYLLFLGDSDYLNNNSDFIRTPIGFFDRGYLPLLSVFLIRMLFGSLLSFGLGRRSTVRLAYLDALGIALGVVVMAVSLFSKSFNWGGKRYILVSESECKVV